MADNVTITPGTGISIATDEIGGVHFQRVKVVLGPDGTAQDLILGTRDKANSLSFTPASDHDPIKTKPQTAAHDIVATVTRPNNQTPYAGGDVVGGLFQFSGVGVNGEAVLVTGAGIDIAISALPSGMSSFRLHLYNAAPPSNLADNAPWTRGSNDQPMYVGYIDLGTPFMNGGAAYAEVNSLGKQVDLATSSLWAYLVTNGGFTPAAVSEVYKPFVHTLEV